MKNRNKACFLYYHQFFSNPLLIREAKSLQEIGFDVDVYCIRADKKNKKFINYEGVNIHLIQSRPNRENSVALYFYRLMLFNIKVFFMLTFSIFYKKYSLIHVTSPPDYLVFTTLVPKLFGTKIILDIHDIGPELYMRKMNINEDHIIIRILKFFEKISCKFSDHVIAVTDLWKDKLTSRSVKESKCSVILNVPDLQLMKMGELQAKNLDPERKRNVGEPVTLIYHGSLEEHFGVDTLLDAMVKIKEKVPNVKLLIHGGGRLKEQFMDTIRMNSMESYVHLNDSIPFHDLHKLFALGDIGIVPTKDSVFAGEALSMKSIEYLNSGLPIVISRSPAHAYYYKDEFVRFFRPGDSEDLAEKVIELCTNPELCMQLVQSSKKYLYGYSWEKHRECYYDIIKGLVKV